MEEVNKLGKILIVDDNEDVLFALNLLLEPYTEKIKVATTPDRIEYFMTTFHPDLILLDMNFSRHAISGQERSTLFPYTTLFRSSADKRDLKV